jgi:hypothetical protein
MNVTYAIRLTLNSHPYKRLLGVKSKLGRMKTPGGRYDMF